MILILTLQLVMQLKNMKLNKKKRKRELDNFWKRNSIFKKKVFKELKSILFHLETETPLIIKASKIQDNIVKYFKDKGAISFYTSIVTHGMQEYRLPTVEIWSRGRQIGYLRHSPQFQKQLIVISTEKPYLQLAPSFRLEKKDAYHIPYLHQLDIEFPFYGHKDKVDEAFYSIKEMIKEALVQSLNKAGLKVKKPMEFSYREVMKKFKSDSPYIPVEKGSVQLLVVTKPPLFNFSKKKVDTTILPMAQPIWASPKQKQAFLNDNLSTKELSKINVYGYDFIMSAPNFFMEKKIKGKKVRQGLEIAGGSIRIKDPEVQYKVLEMTRKESISSFMPLLALLEEYREKEMYTGGGAIGMERIAMVGSSVNDIDKIIAMPWTEKDMPPFYGVFKSDLQFIACGGGDNINRIIERLSDICFLKGKRLGYVIVAAEKNKNLLQLINQEKTNVKSLFKKLGVKKVSFISSQNFDEVYDNEVVILSGGDTSYLLRFLKARKFKKYISYSAIESLVGISAGAIVLFERGIGGSKKNKTIFHGLGFIPGTVVVHSNSNLEEKYPQAVHLRDYEFTKK